MRWTNRLVLAVLATAACKGHGMDGQGSSASSKHEPTPAAPHVVLNPAEMVASEPAAPAPPPAAPPQISKKVVLEVTAKSWQPTALDIKKPLGELLSKNGVGIAADASSADAIAVVHYDEEKGQEYQGNAGFGTTFKIAVEVLDPKTRHARAKLDIVSYAPFVVMTQHGATPDPKGASFDRLVNGPLGLLATAIADAAGETSASERLIAALASPGEMGDASALLEALHFKPKSPREVAYLAVGKRQLDSAVGMGSAAVEPLVALLDASTNDTGYVNRDTAGVPRALGKLRDPAVVPALERALAHASKAAPEDYEANVTAEIIAALAGVNDQAALFALARSCVTPKHSEPVHAFLRDFLPRVYKQLHTGSPTKRTIALHVRARGWKKTRFDVEKAIRAQLASAKIDVAPDGAKAVDAIAEVDYAETDGGGLSTTSIAWSIAVIDPAHQRTRMLQGAADSGSLNEGDDPQALAIEQLKKSVDFVRIGAFVADTVAGESKEPETCSIGIM